MTRLKSILSPAAGGMLCWMLASGAVSPAMAATGRYPIGVEQIAAAMDRMGMQIAPEQVTLLTEVVATTSTPRLRVRSVEPWGDQHMRARLECESSDQCLPFFVGLRVRGEAPASASPASASPASASSAAAPAIPSIGSAGIFAIKNGTEALLRLDSERVHIRLTVICLENGSLGQMIRVTTKDRKMTYRAQVIDGATLQGRL